MTSRVQDTRLLAKALMQRWPIKPEYRAAIVTKLMQVVASPESSPREVTAAAKALMAAEKQNQEDEIARIQLQLQARNTELDEIAADLGLTVDAVRHAIEQSPRDDGGVEGGDANRPRQGHNSEARDTLQGGGDNDTRRSGPGEAGGVSERS